MERFGKLPQGEEGRSSIPEKVVKVTRSADLIAEALCKEERDLWWRCPEALFNPACDPDQSIPPAERHTSMEKVGPVRLPRGRLLARTLVPTHTRGHCQAGEEAGGQGGKAHEERILVCSRIEQGRADPRKGIGRGSEEDFAQGEQPSHGMAHDPEGEVPVSAQLKAALLAGFCDAVDNL